MTPNPSVTAARSTAASWPLLAGVSAIAISPLLMVTTGMSALYNLWLAVMMIGLWVPQRLTKREVGIAVGDPGSYAMPWPTCRASSEPSHWAPGSVS
jgi:hypothetical protein